MPVPSLLFAYFGPETLMPVTSILATVAGVFLMFGRAGFRLVSGRGLFRLRSTHQTAVPAPHVALRRRPVQRQESVASELVTEASAR